MLTEMIHHARVKSPTIRHFCLVAAVEAIKMIFIAHHTNLNNSHSY